MLMIMRYLTIGLIYADYCLVANILSGVLDEYEMPLLLRILSYFLDIAIWPMVIFVSDVLPTIMGQEGE